MSARTAAEAIQYLKDGALANGFASAVFGFEQDINTIPNAAFPRLHILQGTPDGTEKLQQFSSSALYEVLNVTLIAWDVYDSAEQSTTPLETKWTELDTLILAMLKDIFYMYSPNWNKDYKLVSGFQSNTMKNRTQHNQELAEVKKTIQVRIYRGN